MSSYGKPPIVEVIKLLKEIKVDMVKLQLEVVHIKNYIRKEEVRKLQEIEKARELEKVERDYVKTGWFF